MMKTFAAGFLCESQNLSFLSKFFLISNKAATAASDDENAVKDPLLER
jgi:hypothetical protein